METFDTNVVLRMVYRDDPVQADRASSAWQAAVASGGIFLTTVVLVELAWVLRVAAKFDRAAIAAALESLSDAHGVSVEEAPRVRRAIARFKVGAADFSDCLILETARDAPALPVATFDERFAREPDVQLVATAIP
ncbi:MAG TPA: type II toxin-antitoxin system VapC family toxin [Polyangiaceae bacterium]|jgi:predicted nucleic-acid-binding protein|nr:type II toxin-antitoxin system VapC family toxin [Polyangiaceae bacterium]